MRQPDRWSWRRQEGPQYALLKEIFFGGTRGDGKADARPASNQHPAYFKRQDCTLVGRGRFAGIARAAGLRSLEIAHVLAVFVIDAVAGQVSKRLGSPYRSGRSRRWVKSKNPKHPAVKREAEEEWGAIAELFLLEIPRYRRSLIRNTIAVAPSRGVGFGAAWEAPP